MSGTLISADNTWGLMALTCGWVAFSIYAEQTWTWASKVSGAIVAMVGAMIMTNLKIVPTSAVWFDDIVWGYVVPMAIPILLFQCDIKKIWKESGRLLIIFLIGSIGTTLSAFIAFYLLEGKVDNLAGVAAMMTGSYVGGGVNFAAMADAFSVPSETVAATVVADNLLMACYFFVLIAIPGISFFRKNYTHPHLDEVESVGISDEQKTMAASFWGKKPISLMDIGLNIAISVIIVFLSTELAAILADIIPKGNPVLAMLNGLLGNKYMMITTLTMLIATFGSKQMEKVSGSQEIGTYLIYLFLFVIGIPASIGEILRNAPLLFVFCGIMVAINMLFCFGFGKLFKFSLEDIIIASNANIGGPTTAVAMAISKGWIKIVGPAMLVGTFGYVIGNYFGTFVGQFLGA